MNDNFQDSSNEIDRLNLMSESIDSSIYPDIELVILDEEKVNIDFTVSGFWKNVLIVEDDVYLARDYGECLKTYGFNVSYAVSGDEAVKFIYFYGIYFSIVVLDIRLPLGKYLGDDGHYDDSQTGICISKDMREYALQAIFVGLSASENYPDEVWFNMAERHFYCRKNIYTSKRFARLMFQLVSMINQGEILRGDCSDFKEFINHNNDLSEKDNIYINIEEYNVTKLNKVSGSSGVFVFGGEANITGNTFIHHWEKIEKSIDLVKLSKELVILREALSVNAEHSDIIDIGNIASAEEEAKKSNGSGSLEFLSKVSKKSLDVAEKIGVGVAVAAIKATIGV